MNARLDRLAELLADARIQGRAKEPEMPKMTTRRQGVYAFIRNYCSLNGRAPALREIGEAVGLTSSSTVHSHCRALVALGLLTGSRGRVRSYVPVDMGTVNDPLLRFLLLYVRKYPQCDITAQVRDQFGDLVTPLPMDGADNA